jgi:hypothetical protein
MLSVIDEELETSFKQEHNVFSPVETSFKELSDTALSKSS